MTNWPKKRIKDLGRVVTGKTPPKSEPHYFDGEELFVSPKDMDWDQLFVTQTETRVTNKALDKFRNQVIPKNSVMFTSLSFGFGKMGIASRASLTNQQINSVVVNRENDFRFVYYLLKACTPFIFAYNSGIDTPIVPKSVFERIELKRPEIRLQSKIAAVLWAYDEWIENNKRRIALLEKLAEEIYREWFVRLRFPGHERVKVVKRVPSGWSFDKASTFFGLVKGKSYAGDEITDDLEHMPFISLKSFNRGGGYREDGLKYYSGRYKDEQVVRQNDVVVALTDMTQDRAVVGRAARIPNLGERGAVISLDAVKLVPNNINSTFLYAYMRHSGFADFIKEFANGANVLHLKSELITKQTIIIPPRELQEEFAPKAGPIYAQVDLLGEANQRLVLMRDRLLPRLISGKLSIENLDIQLPPGMAEELNIEPTATVHA
jgi:type I restriction enzyme, S subunit